MKLEDQLTSFELSKKLKELGVKQDSLFCWTSDIDLEYLPTDIRNNNSCIAAFSVAEHGERLPSYYKPKHALLMEKIENLYFVSYRLNGTFKDSITFHDKKEADVRAKMRIYLLENGLITNEWLFAIILIAIFNFKPFERENRNE